MRALAAGEPRALSRQTGWMRELRKDGLGALLDPNIEMDGEPVGARLLGIRLRHFHRAAVTWLAGGVCTLIHAAC